MGYFAISVDIFGDHNWGDVPDIWSGEARDAAKHPIETMHSTAVSLLLALNK